MNYFVMQVQFVRVLERTFASREKIWIDRRIRRSVQIEPCTIRTQPQQTKPPKKKLTQAQLQQAYARLVRLAAGWGGDESPLVGRSSH